MTQKIAVEEAVLRRSTRVRAPPRDNPALAFLKYENKWKEDWIAVIWALKYGF